MTDDELVQFLESNGYRNVRKIGGVWCGLMDYLTTRSITVGLDAFTFERRYCYQNRAEADAALDVYTDPATHPPGPWIKVKGVYRGVHIDALNPAWPDRKPWDEVAP